jgi:tRNA nucleotidyltransferase (CCA-adding enzyme)
MMARKERPVVLQWAVLFIMTNFVFDTTQFPEILRRLVGALAPEPVYIVGGLVRDAVYNAMTQHHVGPIDWPVGANLDLATRCRPEETMNRLLAAGFNALPVGIDHGTVVVPYEDDMIELTTFRRDYACDGRHCAVSYSDTLEEDLERRDFTVNSLAVDIESGEVIDQQGGIDDLEKGLIRTVGDPSQRFEEDHLRIMRAVRFVAKLDFALDDGTLEAMVEGAESLREISAERIRDEIMKIMTFSKPSAAFRLMRETGILKVILPELDACFGVEQNRWHSHDVGEHSLLSMDAVSPRFPFLRFVAVLHDLGKVGCKTWMDEKEDYVFYGHETEGAKLVGGVLQRLRFSRRECELGVQLVEEHMIALPGNLASRTMRRYMNRMGPEVMWDLFRLRIADRRGNQKKEGWEPGLRGIIRKFREIERDNDALNIDDLALGGKDLISLGLTPGPVFSEILHWLLEQVLDDPDLNQGNKLRELFLSSPYRDLILAAGKQKNSKER